MYLEKLREYLAKRAAGGLCIAFSGGVDSAVLLKSACGVAENVHAVTVRTPFHPVAEAGEAEVFAKACGAVYRLIEFSTLPEEILENPRNRCYICKKTIFQQILAYAREKGLKTVMDGTNLDDLDAYRPGLQALVELGIESPLAKLQIAKKDVRHMARELGLSLAEKPSAPCLATRIPYDTRINFKVLAAAAKLEELIKSIGAGDVRARIHGDTARLEVLPEDFPLLIENRQMLIKKAKELGFLRLSLDLQGFRSGSFDETVEAQSK